MPAVTTIGRTLLSETIPEDLRDETREFDKKRVQAFFKELAEKHPEKYVEVLQRMNDVARMAATEYGGIASLSLKDMTLPPKIRRYRQQLSDRIDVIAQDPNLSPEAKNDRIVSLMRKAMPKIQKDLVDEGLSRDNAFALSATKGFRGNPTQFTQLVFGDMLVADHKGRPLPIAGLHGYSEGTLPSEYWAGSYGSRKGYADVQFATAKTGFLGKQMAQAAQRLQITEKDCKTDNGIPVEGDSPDNIGTVLARPIKGLKAGHAITKQDLAKLRGQKVMVRTISTCTTREGLCQRCAGKRDQGHWPDIGSHVGQTSARIIAEPLTQELGLSAKHMGGVVGLNDDNISGFDEINQFLQVPKTYIGGSVLSPVEGKVSLVVKAPQGGHYVKIDQAQVYVPPNRTLNVRRGDEVEAGDMLTDGTPNPAEIAKYKGLGSARKYFIEKFSDILRENGVPSHRRNVDALSRAFFDRVRITRPEGVQGYNIGDLVAYSDLQKDWQPRTGTENRMVTNSLGMYLEQPVYYHTIGTRITKKVQKELKDAGYHKIPVHRESPGFEPEVIRLMMLPASDTDWKVRLGGFGLKKSLLQAATQGSVSPRKTTTPVPSLMDPSRL